MTGDRAKSATVLLICKDQLFIACPAGHRCREVKSWPPGQLDEDEEREVLESCGLKDN
jgi:hypothetical protein